MKNPKCNDIPAEFWYPVDSFEQECVVYRWVMSNDKVESADFLSSYERDKARNKINTNNLSIDRYYGISTYEDLEDAKSLKKKVPGLNNLVAISQGITKVTDGRIRKTPSDLTGPSHLTWWLYENAKPEKYFIITKEDNNNE